MGGERGLAACRRRIVVGEVVDQLLDAHRIGLRQHALVERGAHEGVGGGVHVDGEGGDRLLGRDLHRVRVERGEAVAALVAVAGGESVQRIRRRTLRLGLEGAGHRARPALLNPALHQGLRQQRREFFVACRLHLHPASARRRQLSERFRKALASRAFRLRLIETCTPRAEVFRPGDRNGLVPDNAGDDRQGGNAGKRRIGTGEGHDEPPQPGRGAIRHMSCPTHLVPDSLVVPVEGSQCRGLRPRPRLAGSLWRIGAERRLQSLEFVAHDP